MITKRQNHISFSVSLLVFIILTSVSFALDSNTVTITFKSEDSLEITADLYIAHNTTNTFIILFHQAGWSRGEYIEIAPKLNKMGFNCMAIDQRSGESVNDVQNESYIRASKENKPTEYLDAYRDMEAALKFVNSNYAKGKIIVWGSSYSSSLAIKLASDYPDLVDGVLAFSPGEYFTRFGKSKKFITDAAKQIKCSVFITSAKDEKLRWENIYQAIPNESKQSFLPKTTGNHGSRALWEKFEDSKEYWIAVTEFLNKYLIQPEED